MDITSIQIAQVIGVLPGYELTAARMLQGNLLHRIAERYRFEKAPTPDALTSSGGAEFLGGRWEAKHILKLNLLVRGFAVQTQTDTDDSEAILADVSDYVLRELGLHRRPGERRLFFSAFTFTTARPLLTLHPALEKLAADITALVGPGLPYETTSVALHVDDSAVKTPPVKFTIERRSGIPFSENAYISAAPLRTMDHQRLIQELEDALSGQQET